MENILLAFTFLGVSLLVVSIEDALVTLAMKDDKED